MSKNQQKEDIKIEVINRKFLILDDKDILKYLKIFLSIAIDILFIRDNYLLKNDANERSIIYKLGSYLQYILGHEYDMDCEYNRDESLI